MKDIFDKDLYENICKHLFNGVSKLSAGLDRVTADNFLAHKDENYEIIKRKIDNCTYKFTRFKEVKIGNRVVNIPTCRDRVVLEYLQWNIKKRYKVSINSRIEIANDLKNILSQPMDYYIIRMDVKHFFNNINQKKLIHKIKEDSLFSVNELYLIKNMLERYDSVGVPQGIGLSNYLSEIYMKSFDLYMNRISPRLLYYSRYVDDIIIILPGKFTSNEKKELEEKIEYIFKKYELCQNTDKYQKVDFYKNNCQEITYLGYSYQKENKKLKIEIANYKIYEIKKKINFIFDDYMKNRNYYLLKERVNYLTSVHSMDKIKHSINNKNIIDYYKKKCIYGIRYDYSFASQDSFNKINKYIKFCFTKCTGISRKEKRELFSCLVAEKSSPLKIINENNVPIMELKSKVYKMTSHSGIYSWSDLLKKNRTELKIIYHDLVKVCV